MKVHYMSESNEWATPQDFFDKLNKEFNFTLDPCSTKENAKCSKFYTIKENGLKQSWEGETVFVNPPYGRKIKDWVKKSYEESLKEDTIVVMLIPSRTDTLYWHEWIFPYASEILFVKGRLKFGDGKGSAPFPSAVIVFGTEKKHEYKVIERV